MPFRDVLCSALLQCILLTKGSHGRHLSKQLITNKILRHKSQPSGPSIELCRGFHTKGQRIGLLSADEEGKAATFNVQSLAHPGFCGLLRRFQFWRLPWKSDKFNASIELSRYDAQGPSIIGKPPIGRESALIHVAYECDYFYMQPEQRRAA